jgi:uncharacterized UPF0160 family protein
MTKDNSKPKRLITHSEDFHTDDVFATALLLELFPDAEVVRSRDEAVIATGDIVYDVGKVFDPKQGRFDHHQAQAGKRANGIVYSAFGLLWQEYGMHFCDDDESVARQIDEKLVTPIDANDNGQKITQAFFEGVEPFTIDDVIGGMNPQVWVDETEGYDAQFMQAVELAGQILKRLRTAVKNNLKSEAYLLDLYAKASDKRLLITDKPAEVAGILDRCPELLYVVSPRPSGSWGVLAVSTKAGEFTPRKPFPEIWRAQSPEMLQSLTSIKDMVFCHATGFYAAANSKTGAIAIAEKALQA